MWGDRSRFLAAASRRWSSAEMSLESWGSSKNARDPPPTSPMYESLPMEGGDLPAERRPCFHREREMGGGWEEEGADGHSCGWEKVGDDDDGGAEEGLVSGEE